MKHIQVDTKNQSCKIDYLLFLLIGEKIGILKELNNNMQKKRFKAWMHIYREK